MADDSTTGKLSGTEHELADHKREWWWFFLLGVGLIVFGVVALSCSFITTVTIALLFGALLMVAGAAQVISAFWAHRWSGTLVHLLIGILYVVVGLLILDSPLESVVMLTLLLAGMLMVSGIFRIVSAMTLRFHEWGWTVLSGVVSLLLGMLIYKGWPDTGLFAIGLFIGIEMIFNGWMWVMLGLGLRRFGKLAEQSN